MGNRPWMYTTMAITPPMMIALRKISHLASTRDASALEIMPPSIPPASVPAPILLKARAASFFSVFSKISEARSQRLANTSPKIAGMNINMIKSSVLSPGCKKRCRSSHYRCRDRQDSYTRRTRSPGFHRFYEDHGERQRRARNIDVEERQLQQSTAPMKEKRITAGFCNNEGERRKSESD